ncbi:LTA synthase family protein [Bacteroidota bacterium]
MKSLFSFYLRYILFFLGIHMIFHILFLFIYQEFARDVGIWDQLLALVYGLKLDVSLTGYILGLPTLVLIPFSIFRKGIFEIILGIYTFLMLLCLILGYYSNLVIYKYWKSPIDRSMFDYISNPGEILGSISPWSLILILGIIILTIYALYFQVYKKWVSKPLASHQKRNWVAAALFLLILPSLILPIRGGLATSPIQVGSVYFHESTFINHAATNPVWNLFYTINEGDKLTQSISFYPEVEARKIMEELYEDGTDPPYFLNTESPNIILIILESFSKAVISELGGNGEAAPNFNALVSEGIFFNKMFSSGTMTDRAIGALFSGYPAVPGTCVIHYEKKVQKLPNFNLGLKSAGYNSTFLYGGDIDFAHIRSFLVMGGMENIISDKDFSRSIKRSSWGVPDHYLFERLMEVTDQASSPFFITLLTLSSHTPFDVPMETVFPGSSPLTRYYNSIYYTDQSLGKFIKTAKTRDWWDQSLIILMADHGFRVGNSLAHEQDNFSIPMLWLGGALAVNDTIISKFGSQTDLPATLLNQLGLPTESFRFSNDLLSKDTKSFTYYTYTDGVGFLDDSSYAVYSLTKGDYLLKEGHGVNREVDPGLAYLQFLLNDFNSK